MVAFAVAIAFCLVMAWMWKRRYPGTALATTHQEGIWQRLSDGDRARVSAALDSGARADAPQDADAICGRARELLRYKQNPWIFAATMVFLAFWAVNSALELLFPDDMLSRIFDVVVVVGIPVLIPWVIIDRTRSRARATRALEANRDLSPEEQSRPQRNR